MSSCAELPALTGAPGRVVRGDFGHARVNNCIIHGSVVRLHGSGNAVNGRVGKLLGNDNFVRGPVNAVSGARNRIYGDVGRLGGVDNWVIRYGAKTVLDRSCRVVGRDGPSAWAVRVMEAEPGGVAGRRVVGIAPDGAAVVERVGTVPPHWELVRQPADAPAPAPTPKRPAPDPAPPAKRHKPLAPPAVADEPSATPAEPVCVVCQDRAVKTIVRPCGHACLCVTCARLVAAAPKLLCPMCRAESKRIERMYIDAPESEAAARGAAAPLNPPQGLAPGERAPAVYSSSSDAAPM